MTRKCTLTQKTSDEGNTGVYIKTTDTGLVTDVNSDIFIADLDGWILIDEGTGDRYDHAQHNYFELPLTDTDGCHNYKYAENEVKVVPEDEKSLEKVDLPKAEPTAEADLMAMAVDHEYRLTLLELGV